MPTFPTIATAPVAGANRSREARVLKATFGDGYSQRAADGINNVTSKYDLTWEDITRADADTIEAFLIARGGYENFDWTPPQGASAKWTCEAWRRTHKNPVLDTITATFVQVFDLV